ncbi:ATP-binding protein [Streptomyces griseoviridis]|uniref:ATP-binding protein n=1 Tax=Streptomyces griseoviridis TaxID=45398 RepID=UPI0027D7B1A1|nr:XRE family transcriptional regulator [Streptomyces griseoviridis]
MTKGAARVNGGTQEFGTLLRRFRTDRLLTIQGLAQASGVSVRGIGDLERGRRAAPQRRTVAALAAGLGLDADECDRLFAAAREDRSRPSAPLSVRTFPRGIEDFVGRRYELLTLAGLAAEAAGPGSPAGPARAGAGPTVVAVSAPPGMGKTALALQAARVLADRFPDGQMVLDLRGTDEDPPPATEIMLHVLKAFHVADTEIVEAGATGQAGLYEKLLLDRRCLLILDNARDEAQVAPLLPRRGRSMCLVTSRKVLTALEGVHRMSLRELSPQEAITFLGGMIGEERARREASALSEVASRCGYLPLALRIAGSRLATRTGWTVRRLADRLAVDKRRLDVLVAGDRKVSTAFDLSYQQLTPDAATLFRRLSAVPGPDAGAACAAHLLGRDLPSAEDVLEELVEAGLLDIIGDRFRMHDLLRLYAHSRLEAEEGEDGAEAVRTGLYRWLLDTTVVAGRWFEPGHGAPSPSYQGLVDLSSTALSRQWLRSQGINWLAALRAAADAGDHAVVVEVAESLHWFSDQWIFWGHWPEVFRMAADSAETLGDDAARARHLNYCAWTLIVCERRPADSLPISTEAHAVATRAADVAQQAWAHFYRGWAYRNLNQLVRGTEHFGRAAALFASAGDVHGSLQARHGQSHILLLRKDAAAALTSFEETLVFLEAAGAAVEPHIAAATRIGVASGVGRSLALLGRWEEAIARMRAVVRHCAERGDTAAESRHLVHLAEVLIAAGRGDEAREALHACVTLAPGADPQRIADARALLLRLRDGQ